MEAEQPTRDSDYALPLIVAVTGHRDLVSAEKPGLADGVRRLFHGLAEQFPGRRLVLLSPLAEGADQLAARVATENNVDLVVPLPGREAAYLADFATNDGRRGYEELSSRAMDVFELAADDDGIDRLSDSDYARLGAYLSMHCDVLLAIWDGKQSGKVGGTADIVAFHHDRYMPGVELPALATADMLVDDESDLVYHIVCSRNSSDGAPAADLRPLDAFWFTNDTEFPRSTSLPEQHVRVFERGCAFCDDVRRHAREMGEATDTLLRGAPAAMQTPGLRAIDELYGKADWLAIRFQRKTVRVLAAVHVLAFLMGLAFLLYSDWVTDRLLMVLFLLFFTSAVALQWHARRRDWQRKYLEYRTLAEGLRVQLYWAGAGIGRASDWHTVQDVFLQSEDPELGWIRNAMRGAGYRADAESIQDPDAFRFVLNEWVGGEDSGQLGYYARKTRARLARHRLTEKLGRLSLAASIAIVGVFVIWGPSLTTAADATLKVVMGVLLLLFAVREGHAYATAVKELIKQYELMYRIFNNAHRRLKQAEKTAHRRQILLALGHSALAEHADWLIVHRERSLEKGEILRLGS